MHRFGLSLVLLAACGTAFAQPAIPFADAGLHAIQFIDKDEGWAAGDDGVIWHSIDGGKTWERQKSGTRASLRSIHFQTPYAGWVVGRLDTPNNGPSVGVMLKTADGGLTWEEVGTNVLPGLHFVRFIDEKNGFVCGDGSDSFPGGMFSTADGGRTWKPVAASRVPGWRAADFNSTGLHGILAGAWGKLGTLTVNGFKESELDPLSGRTVHAVKLGKTSFAVGDGGLVLASADQGVKWGFANLGLSPATLANCDFKCVEAKGSRVWVAGRPGSVVLHSADDGKTWQVQKTNLGCPANAIHFLDENTGWLVGELGTISATTDGGKTWKLQTGGGQRAAALFLHAHGKSVPFETMTSLGLGDGYLAAAVSFMCADANTALPHRANDASRLRQAVRLAGGAAAESVWSFPLPTHADGLAPRDLLATWDKAHDGKANEHLLRQTVLAIRMWQPEVIVTDVAAASASPAETLVLFAAKEAFKQAADPNAFPEQISELGLKPWDAKKLYALCLEAPNAAVKFDASEFDTKLASAAMDLAEPAVRLVADESASVPRRCFTLLTHRLQNAETHVNLMDGINLAAGGAARRAPNANPLRPELAEILKKSLEARKHLEGLAANSDAELGGVDKAIAALGAEMKRLPGDIAAQTAYAVGSQFRRAGKWAEAREVYALLTEQYPGHPMALEAYRWLLRYHAGTEPRRRQEITQKLAFGRVSFDPLNGKLVVPAGGNSTPAATMNATEDIYRIYDSAMIQKWHQACLDFEPRLAAFGPVYSRDPSAWLNFLAARRQIGKHAEAEQFLREYFKRSPSAVSQKPGEDVWRDCLAAEMWLSDKSVIAVPPKPVGTCRFTETRPLLDGKLDDDCWKDIKVMEVKGVDSEYRTEARFAYDSPFLYIAVTCSHPAGQAVPPVAKRDRDADLRGHDRVDITLDLDRDYQTYYRFQIDHRGCLAEDCWGDRSWNPKYFVAFNPGESGWTAEMAIPLVELTGEAVGGGKTWAANVTRVLPGKGVQAWSLPADAEPRPEGMGLLQFRAER
ncbi:MAG: YCF48-related protein [Gemmataceae bacterium]